MRARTTGSTRATKLPIAHTLTAVVTMASGTAVCSPAMPTSGAATAPALRRQGFGENEPSGQQQHRTEAGQYAEDAAPTHDSGELAAEYRSDPVASPATRSNRERRSSALARNRDRAQWRGRSLCQQHRPDPGRAGVRRGRLRRAPGHKPRKPRDRPTVRPLAGVCGRSGPTAEHHDRVSGRPGAIGGVHGRNPRVSRSGLPR